jgi:hypothetical protein
MIKTKHKGTLFRQKDTGEKQTLPANFFKMIDENDNGLSPPLP